MNFRRAAKGFFLTATAGLAMAALNGCGGGGAGLGGGGGVNMTLQEISVAIGAVNKKIKTLNYDPNHPEAINQQIVDFIRQRPEFSSVEINPTNTAITATLKNGHMFVVFNEPHSKNNANLSNFASPLQNSTREFPSSNKARILNSVGSYFIDPLPELIPLLTEPGSGYQIVPADASIEGLKNVSGDGLFFIQAHGTIFSENEKKAFLLSTSTLINLDANGDPIYDNRYQKDADEGRIGYSSNIQDRDENGGTVVRSTYAISERFVKYYMKFDKNSLVILQACESDYAPFKQAFFDAGASVCTGWSNIVDAIFATKSSKYIISNLLGDRAQNPAQHYLEVMKGLHDAGLNYDIKNNSHLSFSKGPNDFAQLAPSISNADFRFDNNTITLNGTFGSDPGNEGRVSLGIIALPQRNKVKWSSDQIIYKVDGIPPGDYDAQVTVRGHKSNLVSVHINGLIPDGEYTQRAELPGGNFWYAQLYANRIYTSSINFGIMWEYRQDTPEYSNQIIYKNYSAVGVKSGETYTLEVDPNVTFAERFDYPRQVTVKVNSVGPEKISVELINPQKLEWMIAPKKFEYDWTTGRSANPVLNSNRKHGQQSELQKLIQPNF